MHLPIDSYYGDPLISRLGPLDDVAAMIPVCAKALTGLTDLLARFFEQETTAGRLSNRTSAQARAQLLVDFVQGIVLRARTGASPHGLLRDARNYFVVILAKEMMKDPASGRFRGRSDNRA